MEQLQLFAEQFPGRITQYALENQDCDEIVYQESREAIALNLPLAKVRELVIEVFHQFPGEPFSQLALIAKLPEIKIFKLIRALALLEKDNIVTRRGDKYQLTSSLNAIASEPEPEVIIPKALQGKDLEDLPLEQSQKIARGEQQDTPSTKIGYPVQLPSEYNLLLEQLKVAMENLEAIAPDLPNQGMTVICRLQSVIETISGYEKYLSWYPPNSKLDPLADDHESNLRKNNGVDPNVGENFSGEQDSNYIDQNENPFEKKVTCSGTIAKHEKTQPLKSSCLNPSKKNSKVGTRYTRSGIYTRKVSRMNRTYEQSYYHYEVKHNGSKPKKKTIYIPRNLELDVIRMETEKVPVPEIIQMLKSKHKPH